MVKTDRGTSSLPPFWRLVETHGDELLAYVRRLVGRDADEVLQETLLRALRSYPRLGHGRHLRAWLYRIATTTAWDHRARSNGREVLVADPPARAHSDAFDHGFEALIEDLPPGPRKALELRFVYDLDYSRMARSLGCSEDAARQRVSSAVRALRRRMS